MEKKYRIAVINPDQLIAGQQRSIRIYFLPRVKGHYLVPHQPPANALVLEFRIKFTKIDG